MTFGYGSSPGGDHRRWFRGLPRGPVVVPDSANHPDERAARLTFVVVGAGYTGTEVAAQGVLMTTALAAKHPRLVGLRPRWLLVDTAARVLTGLSEKLAMTADRVLGNRGGDVRNGTSVVEATADGVRLSRPREQGPGTERAY
jgi:NADH dehydrogenase